MPPSTAPPESPTPAAQKHPPFKRSNPLFHYAAYFIGIGSLVFVAQTSAPKQIETALLAGAISATSVVSRDWYKARLDPNMAENPTGLIGLFSEMLHAGRAQANTNAAQLKRVAFLQTDLIEAMGELNNTLRLDPAALEQQLQAIQTANLTSTLPALNVPLPLRTNVRTNARTNVRTNIEENGINNAAVSPSSIGTTHVPDSTTLHQSGPLRRPGFDA